MLIFDKLPLWRQALSFAGLNVGLFPEQHCMGPGFDLTVAARQGLSFAGLTVIIWQCNIYMRPESA